MGLVNELSYSIFQLRHIVMLLCVLTYLFACGRIADFLQSREKQISKKELFLVPIAFMIFIVLGVVVYFFSPYWVPPQDSLIANLVYLVLVPLGIAVGIGIVILFLFFRDRLNILQCIDLAVKIVFAPVFDGLKGYITALHTVFILGIIATISFYSSGGDFALITLDFLLLSVIVALYFIYRAFTSKENENKASNFVTALILITPAIVKMYFKELVCKSLSLIPFSFFETCPFEQIESEIGLAISIAVTLLILIPVIPFAYAILVNLLRVITVIDRAAKKL